MAQGNGRAAGKGAGPSAALLRLARVAAGVTQKDAAKSAKVGWRSIQRIELDEDVTDEVRRKVKRFWERRGIAFLSGDPRGWGIRVPKGEEGPLPGAAFRALRVGLDKSVEEAAALAGVTARSMNRLESGSSVAPAVRESVAGAYADLGVAFLRPTEEGGWGFLIPQSVSPETGRVILIRPRRKDEPPRDEPPPSRRRTRKREPA